MPTDEQYRQAAVDLHLRGREDDNDVIIDYVTTLDESVAGVVDRVEEGAWVRGWFYVPNSHFESA